MRLTRIAAATLVAGSLTFAGTGIALADTTTPVTSGSASVVSQSGGTITLGSSSVKPGASVSLSGTFAQPGSGSVSVTSSAFAGPATLRDASPTGFDGFAQIAGSAKPGSYTVTATRGAQTATTTLTVVGSGPAPVPPTPIHHGGTGTTNGGSHGSTSGTTPGTHHEAATAGAATDTVASSTDLTTVPDSGSDVLPWVLGGAGVLVLAGGGAYAIGRGRRTPVDAQTRQDDLEPRTEVMPRR